jgi:hypothetical protein
MNFLNKIEVPPPELLFKMRRIDLGIKKGNLSQ